jgi:hypothetical protein
MVARIFRGHVPPEIAGSISPGFSVGKHSRNLLAVCRRELAFGGPPHYLIEY